MTSRNTAHRNRYFPLPKGMNCRSSGGKQGMWVWVVVYKQITKTIRNHCKTFICRKLEEKEQNKSRNAVYVVEIADE